MAEAVTLNVADAPAFTVSLWGCAEMLGAATDEGGVGWLDPPPPPQPATVSMMMKEKALQAREAALVLSGDELNTLPPVARRGRLRVAMTSRRALPRYICQFVSLHPCLHITPWGGLVPPDRQLDG